MHLSLVDDLPNDIKCLIYSHLVHASKIPDELSEEIHTWKLMHTFRNLIGILGFRNAVWGVIYHAMTGNHDEPVRYSFVNYEDKVFTLWNSMTHEERDEFYVGDITRGYYNDDGLLHIELQNL